RAGTALDCVEAALGPADDFQVRVEPGGGGEKVAGRRAPVLELARGQLALAERAAAELNDQLLNGLTVLLAESALAEEGQQARRVRGDLRLAQHALVFLTAERVGVIGGERSGRSGQQAERGEKSDARHGIDVSGKAERPGDCAGGKSGSS